jgi:hypothetical protein
MAHDMPFIIHSLVSRENPGLLLMISYVSLRNMMQYPVDQESFETVHQLFIFLYCSLISPLLSSPFHPKIHRVSSHMRWEDLMEIGSFHRFGCKTGEASLKSMKNLWSSIGGASEDEFLRAIIRTTNMQINSNIGRPLHPKPLETTKRGAWKSPISIFKPTSFDEGVRSESKIFLESIGCENLTKCAEKIRLNRIEGSKPIHRDSFVEFQSSDDGEIQGGILLEIVYRRHSKIWLCLILEYEYRFTDELLFGLPVWEKTARSILILPEKIKKQIPMIPDFGCCLRSNPLGPHPSPIWLRVHQLIHSPALKELVDISLAVSCSGSSSIAESSIDIYDTQTDGGLQEMTEMLHRLRLNTDYVKMTDPETISNDLIQLDVLANSDNVQAQSLEAVSLKIKIKTELLKMVIPSNTECSRAKRVRRQPLALNDYERS